MSRPRLSLGRGLLVSVLATLTAWVTLTSWGGFTVDASRFLGTLMAFALITATVGSLSRWGRFPVIAVLALQLLCLGLLILRTYGHSWLPDSDTLRSVGDAFREATYSAQTYQAPIPRSAPSVAPILVVGGGSCIVLVDLLAAGLGRVPMAGLPLLLIYSLPVSIIGESVGWFTFILMAAGFLALLFLREDERFAQWGRQVQISPRPGDPTGFGVRTGTAKSNAVAIGGVVTGLALVVPIVIPELEIGLFSGGVGNGPGHGVSIVNPMTDLRRDLHRGADSPLLTVSTTGGVPSYLKVSVLANFNGEAWTTGDRHIPDDQVANGALMPPIPGLNLTSVQTTPYTLQLTADEGFDSHWLPVPDLVTSANAPGEWKYDVDTRDFIAGSDELSTSHLTWAADGLQPIYSANRLAVALPPSSAIETVYTALPATGIPAVARELALRVADGQVSDYEKAVALQDFFRKAGNFSYTLDTSQASGSEALAAFLTPGPNGRRGYCEQFASAFAVMARLLHIPSRVVVGFLNPDRLTVDSSSGDVTSYQFSAYDLHAWPEVYFEGAGWVRFEPTPGNGAAPPSYTSQPVTVDPTSLPTSATPTDPESVSHNVSPTASPTATTGQNGAGTSTGFPWQILAGGLGGLLVLVALALVPRTVRRSRRRARWSVGTAEAAWAELRDSVRDLRLPWPDGRSPHATGETLAPLLAALDGSQRPPLGRAANPEAAAALDRLVGALELERYSGRPLVVDPAQLEADVLTCVTALAAGASDSSRRAATWWPRSLRRPTVIGEDLTRMRSARESIVDHVS